MKEQSIEMVSTTSLLRENQNIITNQIVDNIETTEKSIKTSFDSYKAALFKELLSIKEGILQEEIVPPN